MTTLIYKLDLTGLPAGNPGYFVTLPNRLGITVIPVNTETLYRDAAELINYTAYAYNQDPGSITGTVFWYDGTKLYGIAVDYDKGSIGVLVKNRIMPVCI